MNKILIGLMIAAVILVLAAGLPGQDEEKDFTLLPGFGKTCKIGEDYTFKSEFSETPKMGTAILRVELFDAKGAKATDLKIVGLSGMPSMRGAHDTDEVPFKLNRKGVYLLPVNIVMPGEWEVRLIFYKGSDVLYRARFLFNV